jgi:tRNA G18 (ribose-2'-O)-methylase SpoU
LELVPLYECSDLSSLLRDAKAQKVFVLGADPNASRSLYDAEVTFPCLVVLGNERTGLSQRVKKRCDLLVKIPGAGSMQSLNVSVVAGVILSELARRKIKMSTRAKKARGH